MKKHLLILALLPLAMTACAESNIRPLQPIERVEVWVPDEVPAPTSTAPATETAPATPLATTEPASPSPTTQSPATQSLGATAPATQPGRVEIRIVDPNQAARFIYKATYDNIWQQAITLINRTGFALDRQDYRLGVLTTQPLASSQFIEFWKPQQTNVKNAFENTLHNQRRTIRLTIAKVPGKPDFYEIGIQVLVQRELNPTEEIGGPIFVEGSGFGRNANTLRSDYATPDSEGRRWITLGHDPDLERKLLEALFLRI